MASAETGSVSILNKIPHIFRQGAFHGNIPAFPGKGKPAGMQRMPGKRQPPLQIVCPAGSNEIKIAALIPPVYLVAQKRIAQIRRMHTNLVHAAGIRPAEQQSQSLPAAEHVKFRAAGFACRVAALAHMNTGFGHILHPQNRLCTAGMIP